MDAPLIDTARRQTLGDLPHRTAQRFPDKLALVDGDTRITFAELDAVVDRTAAGIAAAGLSKGDRLALLSHNCWEFAVLNYATARLGVVLVPINFMLGPVEIAFILDHSGATGFVAEAALVDTAQKAIDAAGGSTIHTRAVIRPGAETADGWTDVRAWLEHDGPAPEVAVDDEDPLRLMYTSGTESRPKGAMHSSRSLMWQYVSCIVDGQMSTDDVEVHSLPLYHCAQLDCFLNVDVYLGATSIILPAPDPVQLLRTIEAERVTKLFAPPTVWIALLRCPDFDSTDLSSLQKGYYGASPMPVEILAEMQKRLPDVRLWNFYGQTEMAPLATIL
ncbi:MAG: AMP-binding protein, partial [Nocardioides sp.]